eukprot:snap_masked-scaffold_12-processed-gene-8.38-mRNA-1 protein AED:1.00 eAED:1.00 QI:0/-1/0/0/-1/1/1/0/203
MPLKTEIELEFFDELQHPMTPLHSVGPTLAIPQLTSFYQSSGLTPMTELFPYMVDRSEQYFEVPQLQQQNSCDSIDSFLASEEELFKEQKVKSQLVPKRKRCRSTSSASSVSTCESTTKKQKRTKWKDEEVLELWQGITQHGNNWREIKKNRFHHRTYYQVKDKGRRILASKGWSSGRTKATHDGASEEARLIGRKFLESFVC